MVRLPVLVLLCLLAALTLAEASAASTIPQLIEEGAARVRVGAEVELPTVRAGAITLPHALGTASSVHSFGAATELEAGALKLERTQAIKDSENAMNEMKVPEPVKEALRACFSDAMIAAAEGVANGAGVGQIAGDATDACVSSALQGLGVPQPVADQAAPVIDQYMNAALEPSADGAGQVASGRVVYANWLAETGTTLAAGDDTAVPDPEPAPVSDPAGSGGGGSSLPAWSIVVAILAVLGGAWWLVSSLRSRTPRPPLEP